MAWHNATKLGETNKFPEVNHLWTSMAKKHKEIIIDRSKKNLTQV